jgi:hypothetical protein
MQFLHLFKLVKVSFCLTSAIVLFSGARHPFYLSVTKIQQDAKSKRLNMTCKLFTNDFEEALRKINQTKLDLINGKNKAELNTFIERYFKTHLSIKADSKYVVYSIIGFEQEQEATWVYLESKTALNFKKLEIENSILYDFIKEQTNICEVEKNKISKSSKVSNPEKKMLFSF